MEIDVTLKQILPLQSGTSKSGKEWVKQSFIGETPEQYPKTIKFELFGDDRVSWLNGLNVGAQLHVSFDVESRDWTNQTTGKTTWFTEITCYKMEKIGEATSNDHTSMDKVAEDFFASQPEPVRANPVAPAPLEDDSLPF